MMSSSVRKVTRLQTSRGPKELQLKEAHMRLIAGEAPTEVSEAVAEAAVATDLSRARAETMRRRTLTMRTRRWTVEAEAEEDSGATVPDM